MDGIWTFSGFDASQQDDRPHLLRGVTLAGMLALAVLSLAATGAIAKINCKPILSIKNVREVRASPVNPYTWTATISADSSYCATTSGGFEIDFIQIKENAPDVQFTERYTWTAGQFDVAVELAADESIHDYRIGFIIPCVCRDLPFVKQAPGTD